MTYQLIRYATEGPLAWLSLNALETDVEIESTETEESRRFKQIMKTEGARAAIAWRSTQLR